VFSINSTYSSELTTDHPTWTSKFSEGPVFYYEAIQLKVKVDDPVNFTSDVNVCGFLYEEQFDPTDYSANLIKYSCDEDTDKPFSFTALLKNDRFRILVVTSRRLYETKSFTITMRSVFSKVLIERFIVITRTTTTTITVTNATTINTATTTIIITTTTACRYSHIID